MTASRAVSPRSAALERLLRTLAGRYVLAGQHNYIVAPDAWTDRAERITGRRPIVWGCDLSFLYTGHEPQRIQHCGPANLTPPGEEVAFLEVDLDDLRRRLVARAIELDRTGHIVTLMWHCPWPTFGQGGPWESIWAMDDRPGDDAWAELTSPGTELHRRWQRQVDEIVPYLAGLRDADVPVLWRPYHEMNGVWFWWGSKPGPRGFAALWRMLHDRLADHHGLDNLLWVWNANAPRDRVGDEAWAYADYYPEPERVDVLAADVYRNDYRRSHHDELVELAAGRPIALGEVGQMPTPEVLDAQKQWVWFMPWGIHLEKYNAPDDVRRLYADPRVLTAGDVLREGDEYRLSSDV